MNNLPLVSIIIVGYNRLDLLKQTVFSFIEHTSYPRNKLELILCDDGSPKEAEEEMRKMPFDKFLFSKKNQGLGANTNKGIKAATGEFILQLQDDFFLIPGFEDYLEKGVKVLQHNQELGMIRFRLGVEYTYKSSTQMEEGIIKILSKTQDNKSLNNFLYSDWPHLKRKEFHIDLGLYIEGKKMELTELDMGIKFFNQDKYEVAIIEGFENIFNHIGENQSYRTSTFSYKLKSIINSFFIIKVFKSKIKKIIKYDYR